MCSQDELTIILRGKSTLVNSFRYRWQAVLASAVLHLLATVFAVSLYKQPSWQLEIARGKAMNLTVVLSSHSAQDSSAIELTTEAPPLDTDARVDEQIARRERSDSIREIRYEMAEEDLSAIVNLESTPAVQTETNSSPTIVPPNNPPRREKRKFRERVSIAGAVPVMIKEEPVGASFDQPPSKLPENAPPAYPPEAQRTGRQGRVLLAVVVNVDGTVDDVRVSESSGHADLDEAALEAVASWRFRPATLKGQKVQADVLVPVKFSIRL